MKQKDAVVEILEEFAANPQNDVYKVAAEVRRTIERENEYRRLGALQAHQEYELTKRPWWAR